MKMKYAFKLVGPTALLGLAMCVPCFAQNDSTAASQSMHQAGQDAEQAGSDTANAAKDVYQGTKRAVKDTAITAKIKTELKEDKTVGSSVIHVTTTAGVVTLQGKVPSPEMAAHAAQLAEQTDGVRSVNNQLVVVSSASAD